VSESGSESGSGSGSGSGDGSERESEAQGDSRQQELQCRKHDLVPLTLVDGICEIASTAYYDPAEPIPWNWRETVRLPGLPVAGQQESFARGRKKEFFMCACTVSMNVGKFLPEWTLYHSLLGIDHFIIYDNNSEDQIEKTASEPLLKLSLPLNDSWTQKYIGTSTEATGNTTRRKQSLSTPEGNSSSSNRDSSSSSESSSSNQGGGRLNLTRGHSGSKTVKVVPWRWLKTQQAGQARCLLEAGPKCEWVTTDRCGRISPSDPSSECKNENKSPSCEEDMGAQWPFTGLTLVNNSGV